MQTCYKKELQGVWIDCVG